MNQPWHYIVFVTDPKYGVVYDGCFGIRELAEDIFDRKVQEYTGSGSVVSIFGRFNAYKRMVVA